MKLAILLTKNVLLPLILLWAVSAADKKIQKTI